MGFISGVSIFQGSKFTQFYCNIYSGSSLFWTPFAQEVSLIERCPHFKAFQLSIITNCIVRDNITTFSLPPSLLPSLPPSLPIALPPSLSPSGSPSLPSCLSPSLCLSLFRSLPPSLLPSLPPSLPLSRPPSLPPSLAPRFLSW